MFVQKARPLSNHGLASLAVALLPIEPPISWWLQWIGLRWLSLVLSWLNVIGINPFTVNPLHLRRLMCLKFLHIHSKKSPIARVRAGRNRDLISSRRTKRKLQWYALVLALLLSLSLSAFYPSLFHTSKLSTFVL